MNEQTHDSLEEVRGQIAAIMVVLRIADRMGGQVGALASGARDEMAKLLPGMSPAQGEAATAFLRRELPPPPPFWEER